MTTAKKEVLPITYAHNDVIRLEILILKKIYQNFLTEYGRKQNFFPTAQKKLPFGRIRKKSRFCFSENFKIFSKILNIKNFILIVKKLFVVS